MANAGSFKKGEKRPNQGKRGEGKLTKELKAMILEALDEAGGVEYLVKQANKNNPAPFMALVGKVLPMTVQGPGADGEHVFTVIERRIVKPSS
jgi:hypothetical protein